MSMSNRIPHRLLSLALLLLISSAMADQSGMSDANQSKEAQLTAQSVEADDLAANATVSQVHVYVYNKDDDRLDISLFIDGELIDSNEVSSDSEKKYGSYELVNGNHSFEISWRDEDTKKTYQETIEQAVHDGDSVMIYTTENSAPEEYYLTIQARNENDFDLDAYLYIDGDYEKNKEIKKASSADIGKIELEEGVHEITLRWQDPDTEMQYEKKRQVMVERDDVTVFYAPRGVSFESTEAKSSSTKLSSSTAKTYSSSTKLKSAVDNASDREEKEDQSSRQLSNSSSKINSSTSKSSTSKSLSNERLSTKNALTTELDKGEDGSSFEYDDEWGLYVYALLVLLGLFLFFRH
jgi:hypothetical protein